MFSYKMERSKEKFKKRKIFANKDIFTFSKPILSSIFIDYISRKTHTEQSIDTAA